MSDNHLHGMKILVVEDAFLVAEVIADELQGRGYTVVGPIGRLAQGLGMAATERLDGAFLDVNLAGEFSFAIADKLLERHIPFAFLTGYGEGNIPEKYRLIPRLAKPFLGSTLATAAETFRTH